VVLPSKNGTIAFSGPTEYKSFRQPNYMEGSHHVVIPSHHRVDFFLFGQVVPGADEKTIEDNRVHLRWDEVSSGISVKYYLQRDFWLFTGAVGLLTLAGLLGMGYYWYRIRELTRIRERLGMDVSTDDEGRRPPPGFR
jgi:hypothetical protein